MTRVANRERLDDLVVLLLDAPPAWLRISDLAEELGWSEGFTRKELLYLAHCYDAVEPSGITGLFVRVKTLDRYLSGKRNVCTCGPCGGAGESER